MIVTDPKELVPHRDVSSLTVSYAAMVASLHEAWKDQAAYQNIAPFPPCEGCDAHAFVVLLKDNLPSICYKHPTWTHTTELCSKDNGSRHAVVSRLVMSVVDEGSVLDATGGLAEGQANPAIVYAELCNVIIPDYESAFSVWRITHLTDTAGAYAFSLWTEDQEEYEELANLFSGLSDLEVRVRKELDDGLAIIERIASKPSTAELRTKVEHVLCNSLVYAARIK